MRSPVTLTAPPNILAGTPVIAPLVLPSGPSALTDPRAFVLQPVKPARVAAAGAPAPPTVAPSALFELALTAAAMSFHQMAIETLRDLTQCAPDHGPAWRKLATLLRLAARDDEAAMADANADRLGEQAEHWPKAQGERSPSKLARADRRLAEAMRSVPAGKDATALRDMLFKDPLDVVAMRHLAQCEFRDDDVLTAQWLLERALDLSPDYLAARADYAHMLRERRNYQQAAVEAGLLLQRAPNNADYRSMRADALVEIGQFAEALPLLEAMVKEQPRNTQYLRAYGHTLLSVGRRDESAKAYRACLAVAPNSGEAYWGLADLKGTHLTDADVAAMQAQLAGTTLDLSSRMHMAYALAHALERRRDFAGSFAAYAQGAQAFREHLASIGKAHDPEVATHKVRQLKKVFCAETFAARPMRPDAGSTLATPLFVVGMPRAGSTLVEQILASHSMVEGTRELPLIGDITRHLSMSRMLVAPLAYPGRVLELTQAELTAFGERYVDRARAYRNTSLPYFVDKRPWNWQDAGLIHLILPNAKIIDIRRAPMSACFAMFKQVLPADCSFSYELGHLGQYYNQYVSMMEHWEQVLPGRIHYLDYERLVNDTETEIRRLLDYCGLPFEEGCLRFWENERAVQTPSAEQVRRPIFKDALEQWRNFEPWLGPLQDALNKPSAV